MLSKIITKGMIDLKKLFAVILAVCMITGYSAGVYAYDVYKLPEYKSVQTPTGGLELIEGQITNLDEAPIQLFSTRAAIQPLDTYMREQILNHAETINIAAYNIHESEFDDTLYSFIFQNTDLPIITGYNEAYMYNLGNEKYMYSFKPVYLFETKEESDLMRNKLLSLVDNLNNYASKGANDLEKTLFLFEKISLDFAYSTASNIEDSADENYEPKYEIVEHTPYGFIREDDKTAVCQGFAGLYRLCLNSLQIQNVLCSNNNPSIKHIWNCIKIDDEWYHSDVTWSFYSNAPDKICHNYFLLSDSTMIADGKHGSKSDWNIQIKDHPGLYCNNKNYESGHLYNSVDEPIYRDEHSLYFKCGVLLPTEDKTVCDATFRNDTLKSEKAVFSDMITAGQIPLIALYTLLPHDENSHVLIGHYNEKDQYRGCGIITLPPYPAPAILYLGLPNTNSSIKKSIYMHFPNDFMTPIANQKIILKK